MAFLTYSWRFPRPNKLGQLDFKLEKLEKLEKNIFFEKNNSNFLSLIIYFFILGGMI